MQSKQALEDVVFDLYPSLDMVDIEHMDEQTLHFMIEARRDNQSVLVPQKPRRAKIIKKPKPRWEKISVTHEVREGVLLQVDKWRMMDTDGPRFQEYTRPCGVQVRHDGRLMSASILRHFLITGDWVKRVPKPNRYRAVIRIGARVIHLGYYPSKDERDAAVGLAKLGIFPSGSK